MWFLCLFGEIHLDQNAFGRASKTRDFYKCLSFKYSYYLAEASDEHLAPVFFSPNHRLSNGTYSVFAYSACEEKNILNKVHLVARGKTRRFSK